MRPLMTRTTKTLLDASRRAWSKRPSGLCLFAEKQENFSQEKQENFSQEKQENFLINSSRVFTHRDKHSRELS